MTIKRQLLNFNGRTVDIRMGSGALHELSRLASGLVGLPKRAVLVVGEDDVDAHGREVGRALVDAGFAPEVVTVEPSHASEIARVDDALAACARCGLTADDLIVAVGSAQVCSIASLTGQLWAGGVPVLLVPTDLATMVCAATEMHPFDAPGARGMVSLRPLPSMVVCDLDLATTSSLGLRQLGCALMTGALFAEGKKPWSRFIELAPLIAQGDLAALSEALVAVQLARRNVVKATNPSARQALRFGRTTAAALAHVCGGTLTGAQCLAEGMRFEARVATEAAKCPVDAVFALDDVLFDLGLDEHPFTIDADALVRSIVNEHARISNRFLLPLPSSVGSIRLASAGEDMLRRHAEAFVASRAELA